MILHEGRLVGIDRHLINIVNVISFRAERELKRDLIVVFGQRDSLVQTALFAQGRETTAAVNEKRKLAKLYLIKDSENRIVTKADAGMSPHNYRSAVDIAVMNKGSRSIIDWNFESFWAMVKVEVAKSPLLVWGGNWKNFVDKPHIETAYWREVKAGKRKITELQII